MKNYKLGPWQLNMAMAQNIAMTTTNFAHFSTRLWIGSTLKSCKQPTKRTNERLIMVIIVMQVSLRIAGDIATGHYGPVPFPLKLTLSLSSAAMDNRRIIISTVVPIHELSRLATVFIWNHTQHFSLSISLHTHSISQHFEKKNRRNFLH